MKEKEIKTAYAISRTWKGYCNDCKNIKNKEICEDCSVYSGHITDPFWYESRRQIKLFNF